MQKSLDEYLASLSKGIKKTESDLMKEKLIDENLSPAEAMI